jgi:hypothetical protein
MGRSLESMTAFRFKPEGTKIGKRASGYNKLKRDFEDVTEIFPGFLHVFILLLIKPAYQNIFAGFKDAFKFFEDLKKAL